MFECREDVLRWARSVAHENGFVVVILRSDTNTGSREKTMFASEKPESVKIDGESVEFDYVDRTVRLQVSWPCSSRLSVVEYLF